MTTRRHPSWRGAWIAGPIVAGGCGESATTAYSVSGTVSGAASYAVTVTLSGTALGADRTTKTSSSGTYSFSNVPDGTYTVRPTLVGFSMAPESAVTTVAHADVAGVSFTCDPLLEVQGRDLGAYYQNLSVVRAGLGVNDATVTVNGEVMTHPSGYYEDGYYGGRLASVLGAGEPIVLEVRRGARTVTAIGSIPEAPTMTAPSSGATYASSDVILVTWISTTQPDRFTINAGWSCGVDCGTGVRFEVAGTARSFTIPANETPAGQAITLSVFAYNDGTFSGDYLPSSDYPRMNIRAERSPVVVQR